ncbi:MAG: amidohydrolase family protein [Holophagales bacterium]|nr:amidohydrolase family protein [Holophagales bacterium]MYD22978.1 amidohydrolase family protein [Holophagales bacterium]MYI32439.1 amidohydrolase family protein [Holophagales bacterium]
MKSLLSVRPPSGRHPVPTRLLAIAFALAGGPITCAPSEPTIDGTGTITIAGATLIDGTGGPPIEDAVVIVRDDRIEQVGSRGDVPVPEAGEVIDAAGKFLIPGLVDLHNHYRDGLEEWSWALQLHAGVLTVRSLGSDHGQTPAMIDEARAGNVPAPRIFTAGVGFSHPEGFPPGKLGPATEEEAREMVRELAAQKVDLIKMWVDTFLDTRPKIEPEIRAAIADEAAKHGLPVAAHVFFENDVWQLVDAGVRFFVHGVRDQDVGDEFVAMAQEKGLSFAPALGQAKTFWWVAEHPELLDDEEFRAGLQPALLEQLLDPENRAAMLESESTARRRVAYDYVTKFVRRMNEAGVALTVGSDSGAGNIAYGWGTHHELETLVEDAGLTPLEALAAAGAAAASEVTDDPDFGSVAEGMAADLVLLTADPLADIRNTRQIDRVMQAGVWLERGLPEFPQPAASDDQ